MIEPSSAQESVRQARGTDIGGIDTVEIVRLDHKNVALPASDRVPMPIGLHCSLRRKRTAVGVNRAKAVIRLGHVENLSWRLDDLHWLRIDVVLKRTLR